MRTALLALAASLAAAACSDPTIDVTIVFGPTTSTAPESPLANASYTLSVVVVDATCDEVRYGEISDDELAGGRRASVATGSGARLTGVPRLGDKLLLLEGTDGRGVRVAGGCTEVGDIEGDVEKEVVAEAALRARLVADGSRDRGIRDPGLPLLDGDTFDVFLKETFVGGGAPADVPLHVQLRASTTAPVTDLAFSSQPIAEGIVRVTLAEAPPAAIVGPVELILRAPWADEVLTVPAFFRPKRLAGILLPGGGSLRNPNRIAPSWALTGQSGIGNERLRVAALSQRAGDPTPPVVVSLFEESAGTIRQVAGISTAAVRSIAAWRPDNTSEAEFVMRTTRWRKVVWEPSPQLVDYSTTPAPPPELPADEMFVFPLCGQATALGIVVRAGEDDYEPYAAPERRATSGPLFDLTRAINELVQTSTVLDATILGTACVTTPANLNVPVAIVRVENRSGALTTRVMGPGVSFGLLASSGVSSLPTANGWALIGGEIRLDGPALVGYRTVVAEAAMAAVPDGALEHELAAPPTSVLGLLANGDEHLDTIAAVTIGDRTRLQTTLGAPSEGRSLSGVSLPLVGQDARVAAVRILGGDQAQLLVMTTELLAAFDLTQRDTDP